MTQEDCARMRLLVQAGTDGELSAADAAGVAAHLEGCAACAEVERQLLALSVRLRREAPRHAAPAALRAAVRARVATAARPPWRRTASAFGAGLAVAAGLAFAVLPGRGGDLPGLVLAGHIRALQPGHLMDVASGDQHTVKPWFDGRLDFAPPVKDLAAGEYPLAGGRLDYLGGRAVAALVYRRRQHLIDLFVWPESGGAGDTAADERQGYNMLRWRQDGMAFWAVSDVSAAELAGFVRLWRAE